MRTGLLFGGLLIWLVSVAAALWLGGPALLVALASFPVIIAVFAEIYFPTPEKPQKPQKPSKGA